jgi:uncharacterized lipoprotein YajG
MRYNLSYSSGKIFLGIICAAAFGLSGCVAGQAIRLAHVSSLQQAAPVAGENVSVEVHDDRPYVKNGIKTSDYIGHFRAGLGNTWDVSTKGNVPLAEQLKADLQKELTAQSFTTKENSPNRRLVVDILEYNFDAYMNGRHWYELKVKSLDVNGTPLTYVVIKESHKVKGSFWFGAVGAFKRKIPKIYSQMIIDIVKRSGITQTSEK